MTVESLITQHIDTWTSAVKTQSTSGRGSRKKLDLYGIKKLRELILELAVRGKLVPQDPSDEPASVLLERIAAEKAQLVKDKKISKPKKSPQITEDEKSEKLPEGWQLCRFGELYNLEYGDNLPKTKRSESGEYPVYGSNGIVGTHSEFSVNEACIVVGRKGSAGALNKSTTPCWATDVAYSVTPPNGITLDYCFLHLSTFGLDALGKGIKPGLNRNEANILIASIPPTKEQHRIVAKVDELMALCDQLEQQAEVSIEAHQLLVSTLLNTLTNSADADELMENWTRISDHFDTLFTTEASIDQLKQTILQLAVMGKLVPQDPNDEPASVLLERIAEEKTQLILQKEIPKAKKFKEISAEDEVFSTPSNWSWVRLDTIFNVVVDCPHSTAKFQDEGLLCIDTNSFKQGQLHHNKFRYVSQDTFEKRNARLVPKPRDIIFAREGSVGESVVIPDGIECCLGQRVMLFRLSVSLNAEFLRLTISNKGALNQLLSLHKGIGAKHVNVSDMRSFVICLPPEKEQHLIVTKVEEMMVLCNQLKARLERSQATQLQLTDTIVDLAV